MVEQHPATHHLTGPGAGRPTTKPGFRPKKSVVEWVKTGTYRTREIAQRIQKEWTKAVSLSSLRRLFRANKLTYKRIRKSCRHLRDPLAYAFFREEIKALQAWADTGEIDLCYGDEMGVSRQAVVPYGWQPVGKSEAFMPATPSGNLTTLGFFYRDNRLESYVHQGAMTSALFVKCVDDFASGLTRKTVLILDNASTHKSALVASRLAVWRKQGLCIQYIPAYCPELNLIECLWKQIKYHWLRPLDFLTPASLRSRLETILAQVGTEYRITFA